MMGRWKIGSFTAAIGCIVLGVVIVLAQYDVVTYDALGYVWPALLILFGLEMLLRLFIKSEVKSRVSGWAIVLIIVLVAASGAQTVVSGGALGSIFGKTHLVPVEAAVEVKPEIKNVKVSLPNGKIRVEGTEGAVLEYQGELELPGSTESDAVQALEQKWKVSADGDTLLLELNGESQWWENIHIGINMKDPYLNLSIPRNLAVEIDTGNGSVEASSLDAGIEIDTSNGTMDIHDIAGGVDAHTSNGTLAVRNVQGEVELVSSNGAMTLENIDGPLEAKSSNGKITVNSPVTGEWDVKSSNGKITVSLPAATDATITAETSNGSLKGNVAWNRDGDNDGTAVLGSGTHDVSLSTSNGAVTVDTAE
ncbi:hypothetical protein C2I18_18535 [Paenibacillus sp. PK3_47]|uniref:DUF4097 family beta strand repeat-containing protein n=1 Tax=Paenibacillus sp. PK3_47 TaxID=2072642 RepID=UPI00201E2392|nr:DUF4097 family beta strand repeat-containing protein [Paenibacillus sp. PK3_47]UQZ35345.1 hypothetical protein C2I18_18535 [Paenibacillus sp. PK3_47]